MAKRSQADGPSAAVRIRVMKRDKFQCTYCGVAGTDAELEIDHIVAVANGGSHHMSNLTTACRACNQKKGDGIAPVRATSGHRHPLIGLWFHSFHDNGAVEWQGQIIGVDGDTVIAQLYEWFGGYEGRIQIIQKDAIYSQRFTLYPTNDHMNDAYQQIAKRREIESRAIACT